jgi:hypothetical protein
MMFLNIITSSRSQVVCQKSVVFSIGLAYYYTKATILLCLDSFIEYIVASRDFGPSVIIIIGLFFLYEDFWLLLKLEISL